MNRGSQGYLRHVGEGANSLGRGAAKAISCTISSKFMHGNFLKYSRRFAHFLLNIKDFVFLSFFTDSRVIFCYVIERSLATSAWKEVKIIVFFVYFYVTCTV